MSIKITDFPGGGNDIIRWNRALDTASKNGETEIDFIATRQNEKLYVQVTPRIDLEKTEKREYERLLEIQDNYPNYVLRTDAFAGGNYEGVKTMHVADFLLSKEY